MTPCPVTIRGTVYPSQQAAAQALGLHPATISRSLDRHGHCDFVGTHMSRRGNRNAARPVRIGPLTFPSRRAAAAALGLSRQMIHRFANGTLSSIGQQKVIAAAMTYNERTIQNAK